MSLRPFVMPGDITTMLELLPPSFQYPENPEWSMESDELEGMIDSMRGIRQMWPLVRALQIIVPPLRDIMRGYIWEEDGRPVGLVNVLRRGMGDRWLIGNVSVLPDYRRRGIARKLVEASVEYAKGRGARSIVLDVIDGNLPAYHLYERLGFTHYDTHSELVWEGDAPPEPLPLPPGCRLEAASPFDWRPRFALAKRITPDSVQVFLPVEEDSFRQPAALRPLLPLLMRAMGTRTRPYHCLMGESLVGFARVHGRTRSGGVNGIDLSLDPAQAALAPVVLCFLLNRIWEFSPGRRVELSVHAWDEGVMAAALALGFRKKYDYCSMGIVCEA